MAANRIYLQVDLSSDSAQQNVNKLNDAIAQTGTVAEKSSQQATTSLNKVSVSVKSVGDNFSAMGAALAGLGIERLAAGFVRLSSDFSRIQLAMTAFLGSAAQAKQLFEDLRQVAQSGPFELKDIEQGGRQLVAFGYNAQQASGIMQALSDKLASTGASAEEMSGIVAILGRVMEKEFVGAMDLMRKLPQQGIPVMETFRKSLSAALGRPASVDETKEAITNGLWKPLQATALVIQAVQEKSKNFGATMNDASKAFKDLGDNIKLGAARLGESFAPALVKLAQRIEQLLVPFGKLLKYLEGLPEGAKEWIVYFIAFAGAVTALAAAWKLLSGVLGPGLALLKMMGPAAEGLMALVSPELILGIGALAAALWGLYKFVPGFAAYVDKYIGDATGKFKGMFDVVRGGRGSLEYPKTDTRPGESEAILKKQQDDIAKLQDEAAAHLLQAYASPMEAVTLKYATLFRDLNKQIETGMITPQNAAALRHGLDQAEVSDTATELVKKRKTDLDEYVSYWTERSKGAADAQIAYVEAMDAQSLRGKVAGIDRITQLRIDSENEVAQVQKERMDAADKDFEDYIKQATDYLIGLGMTQDQLNEAVSRRQIDTRKKEAVIDQKAFDETQKYRLEGWKKANDVIIEDQKRVYEAFKDVWGEFFDAITGKAGTVGKALGDMFKKMAISELKETFSNQLAGFSTQAAGYGRPEESMAQRGQGILGILLRRGMPPRSPGALGAPPEALGAIPGLSRSNIDYGDFGKMAAEAAKAAAADKANLAMPMVESSAHLEQASTQLAVASGQLVTASNQLLVAAGQQPTPVAQTMGVPAAAAAFTSHAPAAYQGMIAQATAKYGLPPGLLESVMHAESNFNPNANSGKALGLMQLTPGTAGDLGVTNRRDPAQSIEGGAKYLAQQLQRFGGDIPKAVAAYNAGPGAVAKYGGIPPYKETQAYVPRVMNYMQQLTGAQTEQVTSTFMPVSSEGMAGLPAAGSVAAGPVEQPGLLQMMGLPAAVAQPSLTPTSPAQLAGLPVEGSSTSQQFPSVMRLPDSVTAGAVSPLVSSTLGTSEIRKVGGLLAAGLAMTTKAAASSGGAKGGVGAAAGGLAGLKDLFGIGAGTALGGTTARSVLTSRGTGALLSAGGMALASQGLQKRNTALTTAGGAMGGLGMLLQNPQLLAKASAQGGGLGGALGAGLAVGAGAGLFASGVQRGGGAGVAMDIGGGALAGAGIGFMFGGPLGAAIGAGVGAAVGAVTGVVRLFVKTEPEKIRAQIKQVYGIDISNRQILTQIQQIIDQTYGGNVAVGIRSQEVQNIVRLYSLSTGQAAGLPRPEYNATIAQSAAGGSQLQATYQGGVLVQNPYSGATTYQYQNAVTTAQGLKAGTSLGVPGATNQVNQIFGNLPTAQFSGQVVAAMQSNPAAVANSSAAAARAGDSRMTTTAAMLEPLTSLS